MTSFNVHEAKTHFSRLLERVAQGEEVVIAKAGRPIARLVPIGPSGARRMPDTEGGRIRMSEDFDAPLPGDVLDDFEGRS